MSSRTFQLLEPCGYGIGFDIAGRIGGAPDTSLLGLLAERCRRRYLPPFLNELTFTHQDHHQVRNLYYGHDFFLASAEVREKLLRVSGAEFEMESVRLNDHTGVPVDSSYWAMKVQTRVACIDAHRSTFQKSLASAAMTCSFAEGLFEIELSADLAPYYANRPGGRYCSYPSYWIKDIVIDERAIPEHVLLFEPELWPGHLLIEEGLGKSLQGGSAAGNYYWMLGLKNPHGERARLMRELR